MAVNLHTIPLANLSPRVVRGLDHRELAELATTMRGLVVDNVCAPDGHPGPTLGAVELTPALHRSRWPAISCTVAPGRRDPAPSQWTRSARRRASDVDIAELQVV